MTTKPTLPIVTATCPECGEQHKTFKDTTGATFLPRHQKPGKKPCPVTKVKA